ncbi:methyl-accepting chemotaxis protein [Aeromonas bivalvium]|uniref:methyl-accepting chemotaxis protein n=1 Tax=Aeromonas bivalvium TaxID=440079 RepID=UPI0038D07EE9
MKIAVKLLLAFGFVNLLILLFAVLISHQQHQIADSEQALMRQALPALQRDEASQQALVATVSSLRGYLILGADPAQGERLKQEWLQAWLRIEGQTMAPPLAEALAAFKASQQRVWDLAHTDDNLPAHTLMLQEAGPLAEAALDQLQSFTNEEVATEEIGLSGDRRRLLKQVGDAYNGLSNALSALRDYLISGEDDYRQKYLDYYQFHRQRVQEIAGQAAHFTEAQQTLWGLFEEMSTPFGELVDQVIAARRAPDWNRANHLMAHEVEPELQRLGSQLADQVRQTHAEVDGMGEQMERASRRIRTMLVASTLGVLLLSTLVALWLSRHLTGDIQRLEHRASLVASGRLPADPLPMRRGDELGRLTGSLNQMSAQLRQLVADIQGAVAQVEGVSGEVSGTTRTLVSDLASQHHRVDEVASAIEQISVTSREVAGNIAQAACAATEAENQSRAGEQALGQMVGTMQAISTMIGEANGAMARLSAQSEQVGRVTEVIATIAEQTNLLALNAAIEAARAGEQGRGFAVVADEVRQLASRTSQSTAEISQTIASIQQQTRQTVATVSTGTRLVEEGRGAVESVSHTLQGAIERVQALSEQLGAIATATEQQSRTAREVAGAVEEIAGLSHQSRHHGEQGEAIVTRLAQETGRLSQAISRFTLQ